MILTSANIPDFENKKISLPEAEFLSYQPDFAKIKNAWKEFGGFKNILIIGHGGSINSFIGIYQSLGTEKNVMILDTTDPEYIAEIKNKFHKNETLVIAASKSGDNITQIEAFLNFIDYPVLFIVGKDTPLEQLAKKSGAKIFIHPPIGGRFAGFTDVALVPAAICGIDVKAVHSGAKEFYELYHQDNFAIRAAQIFYALEQKGFVDVFVPFYSHYLFSFANLVVQLCHESFGKEGRGQSYIAAEAPESQHHTNQRFFGGRKNIAGFFMHLENFRTDSLIAVPAGAGSIPLKDSDLAILNKIPLSYSMHSEFRGTFEHAKIEGIPVAALGLSLIDLKEIGRFIAFWQMFAVYSSVLRGVDPFDQPQVQSSKLISWQNRKNFKTGN